MSRVLNSAHAKLRRAYEQLADLSFEMKAWKQLDPYSFRIEADPERYGYSWFYVVTVHHEPPVERWSLIVGDIAHNSRAALNHAAYALGAQYTAGRTFRRKGQIQFPICDRRDLFWSQASRLDDLPPRARTAIQREQPYNRSNPDPSTIGLEALREMDDLDKHRLLHVVAAVTEQAQMRAVVPIKGDAKLIVHQGLVVDQAVVATLTTTEYNARVEVNCNMAQLIVVQLPWISENAYAGVTGLAGGVLISARRIIGELERLTI